MSTTLLEQKHRIREHDSNATAVVLMNNLTASPDGRKIVRKTGRQGSGIAAIHESTTHLIWTKSSGHVHKAVHNKFRSPTTYFECKQNVSLCLVLPVIIL